MRDRQPRRGRVRPTAPRATGARPPPPRDGRHRAGGRLLGPAAGRRPWAGADRLRRGLTRDPTLRALRRAWRQDRGDRRRALPEWNPWTATQPGSEAEHRAELEPRAPICHRCTMEIERMRGLLRAATGIRRCARTPPSRRPACWQPGRQRLKGSGPCPPARARRQLARSGELPAQAAVPPARPGARTSGLRLFMLAAGKRVREALRERHRADVAGPRAARTPNLAVWAAA